MSGAFFVETLMKRKIREYQNQDCEEVVSLFYKTVHSVNAKDYDEKQLAVWAPKEVDEAKWNNVLSKNYCLVAEMDKRIIGFGDINKDGYLDHLFVHKDFQNQGVATELCDVLESDFSLITTHASITAKPFFENRDYKVIKRQEVIRDRVALTNYVMEKRK